jgi:hypothetical protein
MEYKQMRIPLDLVAKFEREPVFVLPDDVFPWGIIIRDLIFRHQPEIAKQLEEMGWQVMLVPGERAFG